jgi:hypothetical protein
VQGDVQAMGDVEGIDTFGVHTSCKPPNQFFGYIWRLMRNASPL